MFWNPSLLFCALCRWDACNSRFRPVLYAKFGNISFVFSAYRVVVSLVFLAFVLQETQTENRFFTYLFLVAWRSLPISSFTDVRFRDVVITDNVALFQRTKLSLETIIQSFKCLFALRQVLIQCSSTVVKSYGTETTLRNEKAVGKKLFGHITTCPHDNL